MLQKIIEDSFTKHKISFNQNIVSKLLSFTDILLEENKKHNLTRITSYEDIVLNHFVDSALLLNHIDKEKIDENTNLIDIGSGAGFPGIVLAIFLPQLSITLVDSRGKKTAFLQKAVDRLSLVNVNVLNTRVEKILNQKFDYATARAVANLKTIIEYSIPILKHEGSLLSQKGPKHVEELKDVTFTNCKLINIHKYMVDHKSKYVLKISKTTDLDSSPANRKD